MSELTYQCGCGTQHVLRIFAHENPPIPYSAWPDDHWYIHDFEPGNEEIDACKQCDRPLPILLYNVARETWGPVGLTADARHLKERR